MHYPHGDGGADRHMAELYNIKDDPGERNNLINDPAYSDVIKDLQGLLESLIGETGAYPDKMPLDEGVKMELPEESIR